MFGKGFKVCMAIVEKLSGIYHVWISGTEVNVFASKKSEGNVQLWVKDIEKIEIEMWAGFLGTQENPMFQDLANFLNCFLNDYEDAESVQSEPHFRELLESEINAANNLAHFLAKHSNELLREGADWIPQWVEAH